MPRVLSPRLVAAFLSLVAVLGASLMAVPAASAVPMLLGEAAFLAARDDAGATEPDAPCEAVADTADELRMLAAADGAVDVICLGPTFGYTAPSVFDDAGDNIGIERDIVIDTQGVTISNLHTTSLRFDVADGRHLQLRDTSGTPGLLMLLRGIHVPPTSSLVVWSGNVMAWGQFDDAAIGGLAGEGGGDVVVRGGDVQAYTEWGGAGIGGGSHGDAGSFTMWGGAVDAVGGHGAGIGGGGNGDGGDVTVHGGSVTAMTYGATVGCPTCPIAAVANGAAIGGGIMGSGGDVLVTGGSVFADGAGTNVLRGASGIGGALIGDAVTSPGTLTVTGGSVRATGFLSGIGGGQGTPGESITITGGDVVVRSIVPIGADDLTSAPNVVVSGGTLDAGPLTLPAGFGDWEMLAVIGAGAASGPSGSLTVGAGAEVSLTARGDEIFGADGLASVEVHGSLDVNDGYLTVSGAATGGVPDIEVAPGGRVTGNGELRGVSGAVVPNHGTITLPVDLTSLTVTHNNYRVTLAGVTPPVPSEVRVLAASLTDVGFAFPSESGTVAWSTDAGVLVDNGTVLAPAVTSGSRIAGTAVVALERVAGSVLLTAPAVVAVGEVVTPVFTRVRLNGTPLVGVDNTAVFTVTGPSGDVTADVVAGDVLTFSTPGAYEVIATSTAPGFTHLSAVRTIEVATPPTITTTELADAVSGEEYSATLAVTGSPTPAITVTGALPPGLTQTGLTISGTPTLAGEYPLEVAVANEGGSASRSLVLRVGYGAPVSLLVSLPSGAVARQGGSVTLDIQGTDGLGQSFDAAHLVTLESDVPTDVVSGATVTFPHASPHVITAYVTANPLVRTSLLVEVEPAAAAASAPLADTGVDDPSGALAVGLLAVLAGAILLGVRVRARRMRGASA